VGILDSVHTLLAMESSMDDALKKDELGTQRNINRKLSGSDLRKLKVRNAGQTPRHQVGLHPLRSGRK
jgi:hypothetical protein